MEHSVSLERAGTPGDYTDGAASNVLVSLLLALLLLLLLLKLRQTIYRRQTSQTEKVTDVVSEDGVAPDV